MRTFHSVTLLELLVLFDEQFRIDTVPSLRGGCWGTTHPTLSLFQSQNGKIHSENGEVSLRCVSLKFFCPSYISFWSAGIHQNWLQTFKYLKGFNNNNGLSLAVQSRRIAYILSLQEQTSITYHLYVSTSPCSYPLRR